MLLTRTYEKKPFFVYHLNRTDREPVDIQSMSMAKVYDDAIRYDFYYNCSNQLTYHNETSRLPATEILPKHVKRYNETRYDLIQVFNETLNMDEKYGRYYNNESKGLLFDDTDFHEDDSKPPPPDNKLDVTKKILAGTASFLFVGFLKFISSLNCVKRIAAVDEDKIKKTAGIMTKVGGAALPGEDNDVDDLEDDHDDDVHDFFD